MNTKIQRKPDATNEPRAMSPQEFERLLKKANVTPERFAELCDRAPRQIYNYKSGEAAPPYLVRYALRQLAS